jgi:adenosylhomocysteine nucleosidase
VTRLGIITGLAAEAETARRAAHALGLAEQVLVVCAGPGPERAEAAVRGLARFRFDVVLSFGLAGGLVPALRPGALVLPRLVASLDGPSLPVSASLHEKLGAVLGAEAQGAAVIVSTRTIIDGPAAKAALAKESGAHAVDMESYGVARAAVTAGIPFLVLRAIADPAGRAIPRAAARGLTPDGRVRAAPVLLGVLRHPREMIEIARLAHDNQRAKTSLRRAARLALPLLLFGR